MITIGVFAIIMDAEKRILCVRLNYAHGGWTTPGGRVEPGELLPDALCREVREETGYEIEVGPLIGTYVKPYANDIVLNFAARITGRGEWSPTDEIAEIRYFSVTDLPDEMSPVARQRIEDGFRGARGVFREFGSAGLLP